MKRQKEHTNANGLQPRHLRKTSCINNLKKEKMKLSVLLLSFLIQLIPFNVKAQYSITGFGVANTYTQNFDAFRGTAATLPTNWTVTTAAYNATYPVLTSGAASPTVANASANNCYAGRASSSSTDYSILQKQATSGSTTFTFSTVNNTTQVISGFEITWNVEQFSMAGRATTVSLDYRINGGAWTTANITGTNLYTATTGASTTFSLIQTSRTISISSLSVSNTSTVDFRFSISNGTGSGSNAHIGIDDFTVYATTSALPNITVGTISTFGNQCVGFSSAEKSYIASGTNLTGDITITPPVGFEISTTSGSGFISNPSSITLTPASGTVSNTNIYVRFNPATATSYSGNITHTSTGATTQNVAVSGTGGSYAPTVTTPTSTTITSTSAVLGGNVTSGGCTVITSYGIYYSTASGFTPPVPDVVTTSGSVSGVFTENVSGLTPGTTYYYVAYATNSSGTTYSTEGSFTTLKNEPTNQVTAFSCGTTTSGSIPLTWTGATSGTTAPDGYLILWSTGTITPPIDGTAQPDGTGVKNITYGTNSYTATGLNSGTNYNFQIWSYTNNGSNINYNLLAAPTTSCNTQTGPCLSEGFSGGTSAPAGWTYTTIGGTYTSAGNYGAASPSIQMDATNDRIETPTVANAVELKFWIKGQSASGSYLLVEGFNGSAWSTIDNILLTSVTTGTAKIYNSSSTPALAAGYVKFRFTYTKSSGNLSFDDVEVTCSSTLPILTVTPATLSGFTYVFGSGPSASQNYTVSGINMNGSDLLITAPVDYEIKLNSDPTYGGSITIPAYNGNSQTINVRLKSGLSVGLYNGEIVAHNGGGISSVVNLNCNGYVSSPITSGTIFKPGELLFAGFDAQFEGSGADDEYLIATLVDITPGTKFSLVNSRYEAGAAANIRTDKWGGAGDDASLTPGVVDITYNGVLPIAAGSVMILHTDGTNNVFDYIGIITGTTETDATADFVRLLPFGTGSAPNLSTSGSDQIYLMQGDFSFDGTTDANQANYYFNGTLLHGLTNRVAWVDLTLACNGDASGGNTRESRLPAPLRCFNVESVSSSSASGYYENDKEHGPTSLRNIVLGLSDVTNNWTLSSGRYTKDPSSNLTTRAAKTYTITTGNPGGLWVGNKNTNWFDCANWESLAVPDETIDVIVDNTLSIANANIDFGAQYSDEFSDIAQCNNISINGKSVILESNRNNRIDVHGNLNISGVGILDMDDSNISTLDGTLNLYGNWNNQLSETAFSEGNSLVVFIGSSPQTLSCASDEIFSYLKMQNTSSGLTLNANTQVSGSLELAEGKINTQSNRVYVTANSPSAIISHSIISYINGNLRRNVTSAGSFDFPVGTSTQYELSNILLNTSSGLLYIDSKFTNPHSTSITISPLALYVNGNLLDEMLDYGFWTLTPNGGTYNYDVTLTSRGHNNAGSTAASHSVIKRPNQASNWVLQGVHNNSDQAMGSGWVTAKRRGLSVFSDFAIAKSSTGSLPVEMIRFSGKRDENNVILNWECATELNNAYFTLQRGNAPSDFQTIATIAGKGNSNSVTRYDFNDENVSKEILYYRLMQTDFDGTEHFAGLTIVDSREESGSMAMNMLYSDDGGIHFDLLNTTGEVNISIFALDGKLLYSRILKLQDLNSHIDLNDFNSQGMVIVRVSNNTSCVQGKTVK